MGERLAASGSGATPVIPVSSSPVTPEPDAGEAVAAVAAAPAVEASSANWPDESSESAFLAEARDRGETVLVKAPETDVADESDAKALPPLNELVERIPPGVREVLDDLFRARFVAVRRVPKRALKS